MPKKRTIPISEYISGWTLYVCLGRYAAFDYRFNDTAWVVTLGAVSVGVVWLDVENLMAIAHYLIDEAETDENGRLTVNLSDDTLDRDG